MKQAHPTDDQEIESGRPFTACRIAKEAAITPRCSVLLMLCFLAAIALPVLANDLAPIGATVTAAEEGHVVNHGSDNPKFVPGSGALHARTLRVLQVAFRAAVEHVRKNPECRDLFAQLGENGLEKLTSTLYHPSTTANEVGVCRRGMVAYTFLKNRQVWLCRRFASLSTEQAATVLIHEALHYAGLSDHPRDPRALHAEEIDSMVGTACDF